MPHRKRGRAGVEQRLKRLAREPFCRSCRTALATVPDHIVPLALGGTDDDSNIQCLCTPCHDAKTRRDFGHRERREIGLDGYPIDQ